MSAKPKAPRDQEIAPIPRRAFVSRAVAFLVGSVIGFVPLAVSVVFFFDPLSRKKRAVGMTGHAVDSDGFVKITSRDALAADGSPRPFKVMADLQDFWNKFPNSEIGSVYLSQDQSGAISCFNTRCPHLGCTVKYEAEAGKYQCPCHESAFDLAGHRTNSIPPRDMDALEHRTDEDGMIWVKYRKFRAGIHDKQAI